MQARTCGVDGLDHVRAGAHAMARVDAAAHARIHVLHILQNVDGRGIDLVFRAVIVDGDA